MASNPLPKCTIIPLPHQQFSFSIADKELTRWHFSTDVLRPYFFPIVGPNGQSLTRMGHPGAPNHDHHRSLWFAHSDLYGHDFWSENTSCRIEQKNWVAILDGDDEATLAVELLWLDGHDPKPLIQQEMIASIRPGRTDDEWTLELQSDFRASADGIEFRKNNFGILGLRVAKSLSVVFGAGTITGSSGAHGESNLFGRPNRWVDYSGPIAGVAGTSPTDSGLTLIDHRHNPGHPTKWHIRDDGWIGPSLSRDAPISVPKTDPLTVRFLLHVHGGQVVPQRASELADEFDSRPKVVIEKSKIQHNQWQLPRLVLLFKVLLFHFIQKGF